jgi:FK506-binding nuclear protein
MLFRILMFGAAVAAVLISGCAEPPNMDKEVNRILDKINAHVKRPDPSRYRPPSVDPGPAEPDYDKARELSKQVKKLKVEVLQPGSGPQLEENLFVNLDYVGRLMDGYIFENSYRTGQRLYFRYKPGQVIRGMYEGLRGIRVGEKRRITIPAEMAYGSKGAPPKVPADMALVFEVYCLWVGK